MPLAARSDCCASSGRHLIWFRRKLPCARDFTHCFPSTTPDSSLACCCTTLRNAIDSTLLPMPFPGPPPASASDTNHLAAHLPTPASVAAPRVEASEGGTVISNDPEHASEQQRRRRRRKRRHRRSQQLRRQQQREGHEEVEEEGEEGDARESPFAVSSLSDRRRQALARE